MQYKKERRKKTSVKSSKTAVMPNRGRLSHAETGGRRQTKVRKVTCRREESRGSGQVVRGRQSSSDGPQGPQSSSPGKTSQQVAAEVQLVGVGLHELPGEAGGA